VKGQYKMHSIWRCTRTSPASAREICGHKMDMDDIVEEATKDEMFYIDSGSGVTIGGGDPLFFPEFTLELTRRLKDRMLNVAIDTAAFCRWSYLDELSDCADLFLVDLKTSRNLRSGSSKPAFLRPIPGSRSEG